ncbi:MAG TPA: hypothetical protein VK129_13695 [Terriglobales bacterium]|nr:hypothetical protein [Terriglobales bacterium]
MTVMMRKAAVLWILFSSLLFTSSVLFVATLEAQSKTDVTRDKDGNITGYKERDERGNVTGETKTEYDKEGRATSEDKFDAQGNKTSHEETEYRDPKTGDVLKETIDEYYPNGRLKSHRVITHDPEKGTTVTGRSYDVNGNPIGDPKLGRPKASTAETSLPALIQPDNISAQQPFTFAVASGVVEGEVVDIQTVDGTVVQQNRTDKYGRVFLAAGLPAGAYLISKGGPQIVPVGKIEVKQAAADWPQPSQPLQLQSVPQAVKRSDALNLAGHGFSGNYADMQVVLAGNGQSAQPIVLAATEDQLKLAPLNQVQPGISNLTVTNRATGQSSAPQPLLVCDMQAHLQRNKLMRGTDATQLLLEGEPRDLPLNGRVKIVSGPVDFGAGQKEATAITSNGMAVFPVHAERNAGPFEIAWMLEPVQPALAHANLKSVSAPQALPNPKNQSGANGNAGAPPVKVACNCGCGGTAQPRCAHKGCACSKSHVAAQ